MIAKNWLKKSLHYYQQDITLYFLVLIVGIIGGISGIAFILSIEYIYYYLFNNQFLKSTPWLVIIIPMIGGLLVGIICRWIPLHRPHSIAEVVHATIFRSSLIRMRYGLLSALASIIGLSFGSSAGREAPMIHLTASIISSLARRFHLSASNRKILMASAMSAAVAASTNAPIAATLFGLEIILRRFNLTNFTPVALASVCGTLVGREFIDDNFIFANLPDFSIQSLFEVPYFFILGILAAFTAIFIIHLVNFSSNIRDMLCRHFTYGYILAPILAGAMIGILAYIFPDILGDGMLLAQRALHEESAIPPSQEFWLLSMYFLLKIIACCISMSLGLGGGAFTPTLVIGALLGGAFGIIINTITPDISSGYGAYSLIGLSAVAGAVVGAPLSTIIVVFELTNDTKLLIAVIISTVVAMKTMRHFSLYSLFFMQLKKRGEYIYDSDEYSLIHTKKIDEIKRHDIIWVDGNEPATKIREIMLQENVEFVMVRSPAREATGNKLQYLAWRDLALYIHNEHHHTNNDNVNDEHISNGARNIDYVLHSGDSIEYATAIMEKSREDWLLILSANNQEVVGIIYEKDLLRKYHHVIIDG